MRPLPLRRVWFGLVSAIVASGATAPVDAQNDPDLVVQCYEEANKTLSRKLAGDCKGRVVSDDEAGTIKKERRARLLRAMDRPTAIVPGKALASIGTGFFIGAGGEAITNYHVVEGCEALSGETPAGKRALAELLATDARNDLALVRVAVKPPAVAMFRRESDVAEGLRIATVGYPTQGLAPIKPFFTPGMTLGPELEVPHADLRDKIRIKAKIRPGNSGGPLLSGSGLVAGVIFAKINTPGVFQATGEVVRDVAFAIRNEFVFRLIEASQLSYRTTGTDPAALSDEQLFRAGRSLVVRIGCWR